MDQELNFSLSYDQLTREAEDAIKKCNLGFYAGTAEISVTPVL
ncbi:TPA: hypothetical protein ACKPX0_004592 [Serratia marcescens]